MLCVLAGGAALVPLAGLAHCGTEWAANRSAERARAALRAGATCADLVSVAERLANAESARSAREACTSGAERKVTLNFSRGMSLNYLVTVDVSRNGRILAVSNVGAW